MIYLVWKNGSNGSVVNGWTTSTCSGIDSKQIDFVDTYMNFGNIRPGSVSDIVTFLVSFRKFDAASIPTQPITGCKLFLVPYYPRGSTQTIEIPSVPIRYSDTWRFCGTGSTRKTFSGGEDGGYWGSAEHATDDINEIQMSWPEMSPHGGVEFSVDRGCTWNVFSRTVGVYGQESTYFGIGDDNGGSSTANQIDPSGQAELQFRVRVPSGVQVASTKLFLIGMQYDYVE